MDGLPIDTDLSPLVGRRVTEARISKHRIHYLLNDEKPEKPDISIEIESGHLILTNSSGKHDITEFRTNGGLLSLLIGLTIETASRTDEGGLALSMEDGVRLEITIDTSKYECVVLHIGDRIVVG